MQQRITDQKSARSSELFILTLFSAAVIFLSSCGGPKNDAANDETKEDKQELKTNEKQVRKIKPEGPKPAWAPDITEEMQTVIEAHDSLGPKPLNTLSAVQARKQPSPADAAMAVINKYEIQIPTPKVDTTGQSIPVKGGSIHARVYTPQTGKDSYPIIVYYHGGGWVIATIDTYNASAQALAEQAEAVVVAVEYRKGPEHKYPTAHADAFAAYKWTLANAATIKGDTSKVALVGESAGGNLAIAVSMMARDAKIKLPDHQVAIYPIADNNTASESYVKYAEAKPLNKAGMEWFFKQYLANASQGSKSNIALVKADLANLPSTTIIGAEIDPLQSEGKLLADKLEAAKVPTTYKLYSGVTHEFFGMALVVPEAKDAQELVVKEIKKAF
ncbi:MAG: alpha/beta hydrolase [Chryseolinea sp.]